MAPPARRAAAAADRPGLRIRYAKRGRLRFASAPRPRPGAGTGAAAGADADGVLGRVHPAPEDLLPRRGPAGAASEAEYVETAWRCGGTRRPSGPLSTPRCPPDVAVLECVEAADGGGSLADRRVLGLGAVDLPAAGFADLCARRGEVPGCRPGHGGEADQERAPRHRCPCPGGPAPPRSRRAGCAILHMVVRQVTPTRPTRRTCWPPLALRPPLPPGPCVRRKAGWTATPGRWPIRSIQTARRAPAARVGGLSSDRAGPQAVRPSRDTSSRRAAHRTIRPPPPASPSHR